MMYRWKLRRKVFRRKTWLWTSSLDRIVLRALRSSVWPAWNLPTGALVRISWGFSGPGARCLGCWAFDRASERLLEPCKGFVRYARRWPRSGRRWTSHVQLLPLQSWVSWPHDGPSQLECQYPDQLPNCRMKPTGQVLKKEQLLPWMTCPTFLWKKESVNIQMLKINTPIPLFGSCEESPLVSLQTLLESVPYLYQMPGLHDWPFLLEFPTLSARRIVNSISFSTCLLAFCTSMPASTVAVPVWSASRAPILSPGPDLQLSTLIALSLLGVSVEMLAAFGETSFSGCRMSGMPNCGVVSFSGRGRGTTSAFRNCVPGGTSGGWLRSAASNDSLCNTSLTSCSEVTLMAWFDKLFYQFQRWEHDMKKNISLNLQKTNKLFYFYYTPYLNMTFLGILFEEILSGTMLTRQTPHEPQLSSCTPWSRSLQQVTSERLPEISP